MTTQSEINASLTWIMSLNITTLEAKLSRFLTIWGILYCTIDVQQIDQKKVDGEIFSSWKWSKHLARKWSQTQDPFNISSYLADYYQFILNFTWNNVLKWFKAAVPNLFLLAYHQAEKRKITYPLVSWVGILWHFHWKSWCKSKALKR